MVRLAIESKNINSTEKTLLLSGDVSVISWES